MVKHYIVVGEKNIDYTYRTPHVDKELAEQEAYVQAKLRDAQDAHTSSRATASAAGQAAAGQILWKWGLAAITGAMFIGNRKNWPLLKFIKDDFKDVEKEFAIFKKQVLQLIADS